MKEKLKVHRVLCMGLGVQTTALLMAYENNLLKNKPDVAIFSDTHAEPDYIYENLKRLRKLTSIPIISYDAGDLIQKCLDVRIPEQVRGGIFPIIPIFFRTNKNGRAMATRSCTLKFKIRALKRAARKHFGYSTRGGLNFRIDFQIGISTDEADRMYETGLIIFRNVYPLIEDLKWDRKKCVDYMQQIGIDNYGRSACFMCPFKSDLEWLEMKERHPDVFEKAVKFDSMMREKYKFRSDVYLHRSLKPLKDCTFDKVKSNQHTWSEECKGVCGL